jgi:DNA-binding NarL/FixJ family response regulator
VRSVLVCVHSHLAEQAVTNAAAQLGLADVVSTACGGAEALARVNRSPADVLLVDTASVRPDTVSFTRRVLERSPGSVVVFFGPEDAVVARGAVAAGARGLIRGGEREDLVASVAKALMLLLRGTKRFELSSSVPLPLQRSEAEEAEAGVEGERGEGDADDTAAEPGSERAELAAEPRDERTASGTSGGAPGTTTVEGVRRLALTERELQVLRGMADGKSNAEIGKDLFVSEDTVKTHARRLFRKLAARDRAHAVAAAFRAGLVR